MSTLTSVLIRCYLSMVLSFQMSMQWNYSSYHPLLQDREEVKNEKWKEMREAGEEKREERGNGEERTGVRRQERRRGATGG